MFRVDLSCLMQNVVTIELFLCCFFYLVCDFFLNVLECFCVKNIHLGFKKEGLSNKKQQKSIITLKNYGCD